MNAIDSLYFRAMQCAMRILSLSVNPNIRESEATNDAMILARDALRIIVNP
jgi:hypothetical protein